MNCGCRAPTRTVRSTPPPPRTSTTCAGPTTSCSSTRSGGAPTLARSRAGSTPCSCRASPSNTARRAGLWDRLLAGRTARIVMTMDSPRAWNRLQYRNAAETSLKNAILGYCGIKTVGITRFAEVRHRDAATRERWVAEAARLGGADAAASVTRQADAALDRPDRAPPANPWHSVRMKKWIVPFGSLLVFNVAVLLVIGWLTPAHVGWAAIWAGVVLTALTLWIKPARPPLVPERWRRGRRGGAPSSARSSCSASSCSPSPLVVWVVTVLLSGVSVGRLVLGLGPAAGVHPHRLGDLRRDRRQGARRTPARCTTRRPAAPR